MNEDLRSLIYLQNTDLKITELSRKAAEVPRQISTLDTQLSSHQAVFDQAKQKLMDTQKERRRLEGEVELLRGRLSKYKDQLMAVKKNEEYTAVLKEIEACKVEIDRSEDRILEFMEYCDTVERELKGQEAALATERERINRQKRELQTYAADLQAELVRLSAERHQLESRVSPEMLDIYNRIAHQRRGLAMAEARDESCQACHVRLRPQVYNDVRLNNQIILCESCSRILYWNGEVAGQVQTDA